VDGSDELLSTILARVFWTCWTLQRLDTKFGRSKVKVGGETCALLNALLFQYW